MYTLLYFKWITPRTYYTAHGTLLNVMCQLGCERCLWRMNTCICMTESLHCSPETITFFIGYTPIQNVFSVKKYIKFKIYIYIYINFFKCSVSVKANMGTVNYKLALAIYLYKD